MWLTKDVRSRCIKVWKLRELLAVMSGDFILQANDCNNLCVLSESGEYIGLIEVGPETATIFAKDDEL